MNQITATFSIVTPMFLGGAEPTKEAELRVPSIKGALRFWWRALMWGNSANVAKIHDMEAALFGSSDVGQSQFLMRLDTAVSEANAVTENWPPTSWQRYSGYGLRDKGGRKFLKPGREFAVHLNTQQCNDEQRQQLIVAIQLFGLVGNLGSRARKGWGSLTLTKMEGAPWACPVTGEAWKAALKSLVPSSPETPPFTAFTDATRWNFGPMKKDASAAQQWLAQQYQTHVKSTDSKGDRAQFGLPREFKNTTPPRRERRASPLLLHIHRCPNGQALPTAIWLPATFLPDKPAIPGAGTSARQFVESLSAAL